MSRNTIGFDDLKAIGIPHSLPAILAMSEMSDWFPRPINGKYAKCPVWNRQDVERWYRENIAPNDRRREPIGSAKWWD
jgi:hypothetical protein